MDETIDKRPTAALINKEWFTAASDELTPEQLGKILINAVGYVFSGVICDDLDEREQLAFAFIRKSLDSDIAKYRARCERNAENAKRSKKPVAASGTQSQRVGSNSNSNLNNNPNPTSNNNLSLVSGADRERELWLIYGYFWVTGSKNVNEETKAFWSYYEALGWKNNKGAEIVNKLAAARMWRRQFETGKTPDGAAVWYKCAQFCRVPDVRVWSCFAGAERKDTEVIVRLACAPAFVQDLVRYSPGLLKGLQSAWKAETVTLTAIYS